MEEREIRELIKKVLEEQQPQFTHQSQISPGIVKNRHIEGEVIKFGLLADRPTDGGKVGVRAFFSTDNDTLALWNGTAWVEEVLT